LNSYLHAFKYGESKKKNFNQQQKATPKTLIQTNKNKMGKLKWKYKKDNKIKKLSELNKWERESV
jgi:hypothetical protein